MSREKSHRLSYRNNLASVGASPMGLVPSEQSCKVGVVETYFVGSRVHDGASQNKMLNNNSHVLRETFAHERLVYEIGFRFRRPLEGSVLLTFTK